MQDSNYHLPIRFRKMENLHIVFWLFKDISWCIIWKPLGIAMVLPTLIIAIIIAARAKQQISEICHNWAVIFWISANSYWMVSEFLHFDTISIYGDFTYKHIALIPFVLGILTLAYYYLWWRLRNPETTETL